MQIFVSRTWVISCLLSMVLGASRPALGQCEPDWVEGKGLPGVNGFIYATTNWDPDGDGPIQPWLVLAGEFDVAGDVFARNIAAWDGVRWQTFGEGLPAEVYVLAVLDTGELIAGGSFPREGTVQPAGGIRKWNGTGWDDFHPDIRDDVYTILQLPNGQFVYGGPGAARMWNGTSVVPLGTGSDGSGINGRVRSLVRLPDGQILAGGDFSGFNSVFGSIKRVARWDGRRWFPMIGDGQSFFDYSSVRSIVILPGGDVVIAGIIEMINGPRSIAVWREGAWQAVPSGGNPISIQRLIAEPDGSLIASGVFRTSDNVRFEPLARWRDNQWMPLPDFVGEHVTTLGRAATGELVVGGSFHRAGGQSAMSVAFWSNERWSTVPGTGFTDLILSAIPLIDDRIAVAGGFEESEGAPGNRIAIWDGTNWSRLGDGLDNTVRAIVQTPSGDIVAIGAFHQAGGVPVSGVARWDGSEWHSMGTTQIVSARALTVLMNGDIIAAGNLGTGSTPGSSVAARRWDGSEWRSFAEGNSIARASALLPDGRYVIGGQFTSLENVQARLAVWNGFGWAALGPAAGRPTGEVFAMATVQDGSLVVAARDGEFNTSLYEWNGVRWSKLTTLQSVDVYAIAPAPDRGFYVSTNPPSSGSVQWWSGNQWSTPPMAAGYVYAVLPLPNGNQLFVGSFVTAVERPYFALAEFGTTYPEILEGVPPSPVCKGETARFTISALGTEPFGYQWRMNGLEMDTTSNPTAGQSALSIVADSLTIGATFDCVVTNACGMAISGQFSIEMLGPEFDCPRGCPGDFNLDGNVDLLDLLTFHVESLPYMGLPAQPGSSADYDQSGLVDLIDLLTFVDDWFAHLGQSCP